MISNETGNGSVVVMKPKRNHKIIVRSIYKAIFGDFGVRNPIL